MRRLRLRRRRRDDRGAVALIVAFLMTVLLVITALVLDFGLVRVDRQIDRSAADSAVLAGLPALNPGDGLSHPYQGVCAAARFLKVNHPRFATANENAGWQNGLGVSTADGCTNTALRNLVCDPLNKTTWARWRWTGTHKGVDLTVTIESGYDLAANTWQEDSLAATSGDNGDAQGCDNLAVTVSQSRDPGLGTLATSSDLQTSVRSVGRVKVSPGGAAPAMLLLKRTGCPTLVTGSNAGGSWIRVYGAGPTSDGRTQPGTVHSDSDGAGCTGGNNSWVFGGRANNGIVAYAAPLAANPAAPDPSKPGVITSTAVSLGVSGGPVRDALNHVYGSDALTGTAGAKAEVAGRSLVTRGLVDDRYFVGVKAAIAAASSTFTAGAASAPAGWVTLSSCNPNQAAVNALGLTSASRLWIECNAVNGFRGVNGGPLSIPAGRIFFTGRVNPQGDLLMPNATHIYVNNGGGNADAISISNNTSWQSNTGNGNTTPGPNCTTSVKTGAGSRSTVFIRDGAFKQTGGLLRMCRTTGFPMGGLATGCVPATSGTAPTSTPCAGTRGTGQFTQTGGGINWTAPNTIDQIQDANGVILPAATAAWSNPDGPEDLALWAESGTDNSNTFNMAGGGVFDVRGIFMVPNAEPFILQGGANLNLTNAQYITTTLNLGGNTTTVEMRVDPNSAISLPDQAIVGLVR